MTFPLNTRLMGFRGVLSVSTVLALHKAPTKPHFPCTHGPLSSPCVTAECLLIHPLIPLRALFPSWLRPLCHCHAHAVSLRKIAGSESLHAPVLLGSLLPPCWLVSAVSSMSLTSSSPAVIFSLASPSLHPCVSHRKVTLRQTIGSCLV